MLETEGIIVPYNNSCVHLTFYITHQLQPSRDTLPYPTIGNKASLT